MAICAQVYIFRGNVYIRGFLVVACFFEKGKYIYIYRRERAFRKGVNCENSDSKELLKERSVFLSPVYTLRRICAYGEFENIVTKVEKIIQTVTKGWSFVPTSPSSFMVCIGETVSVSVCEDSVGSTASEYVSVL